MSNGQDNTPFSSSIKFSQCYPVNLYCFMKKPGLIQGILPVSSIKNQKYLNTGPFSFPVNYPFYLFQFLHQVFLSMQTAGSINNQQINTPGTGCLNGIKNYGSSICPFLLGN